MNKPVQKQKEIIGKVVSLSSKNTVIVEVSRQWRHPIYKKAVRRTRRIPAHLEGMDVSLGSKVRLVATRPISKTKHYKVIGAL